MDTQKPLNEGSGDKDPIVIPLSQVDEMQREVRERLSSDLHLMQIVEQWNDQNYHIEQHGAFPSVVIIGEHHNEKDFMSKQVELIESLNPEYVLHESGGVMIYNPRTKKYTKQKGKKMRSADEWLSEMPSPIIELSDRMGFYVVGCDVSMAELEKVKRKLADQYPDHFRWEKIARNIGALIERATDRVAKITTQSDIMIPFRDKRMTDTIIEYRGKSEKPVIVIMGSHHGNNIVRETMLHDKGFDFVYVDQTRIKNTEEST